MENTLQHIGNLWKCSKSRLRTKLKIAHEKGWSDDKINSDLKPKAVDLADWLLLLLPNSAKNGFMQEYHMMVELLSNFEIMNQWGKDLSRKSAAVNEEKEMVIPVFRGNLENQIFIGGLHKDTNLTTFMKYFGKYGEITDSVIMKDRYTGQLRGFGFITYVDPLVVDKVIEENHVFNGKQLGFSHRLAADFVAPAVVPLGPSSSS
ncbi:hypothetical protein Sjap_010906 [Stephania japonica]|uniref:RRM domain-containing protein n=1 Tax=Stephania japonica TaxID=461633 RepID=A0AAP0P502_9MAGN